jgi:hypothetical protein
MRKSKFAFFVIICIVFYVSLPSFIFAITPDGDVAPLGNRDGKIEVGDALVCLRFALGLESPTQNDIEHGDVAPLDSKGQPNPDGALTIGDALVILRMALGLIESSFQDIWSGKDISFTVSGDPPFVIELSVTYSGSFVGTKCSGPYTKKAVISTQPGFPIKNNAFTGKSESFLGGDTITISGIFLDSENAEIDISWVGYDSYCDAEYSGSQKYMATHQ